MYDIIIYRQGQQDYMIECDSGALDEVVKHLKRYALRSKVSNSLTVSLSFREHG